MISEDDIIRAGNRDIDSIYTGTEKNILLKLAAADAQITAASSDDAVVSAEVIGSQIVVKAVSAGTAVITVKASAEGYKDQVISFTVR